MIKGGVKTEKNKPLKCVTLGIFFLLIGISILPSVSSTNIAISQYVSSSKTVIRVDDDGDGDYTSIQDAIDNATNGDIIEVYSGAYDDIITVDKQLTLMGIDSELGGGSGTGKPLLNRACGENEEVIHVTVDGCSISGLRIDSNSPEYSQYGILIVSDNNEVYQNDVANTNFGICFRYGLNNRIYENIVQETFYGILIHKSHNNQIFENNLDDNGYGIRMSNFAENNMVYNNIVSDTGDVGIGTSRANNNTIHENTITTCKRGIKLWKEDENGYGMTVYGNTITSCDEGIMVTGNLHKIYQNNITNCEYGIRMEKIETLPPIQCSQNKVYENNVINSGDTGIYLDGVYTSDIYRNNITGGEIGGLLLDEAEENNIFENNVTYNDYGIHLIASENNIIYHNNFIGNTDNAYCYGEPWDRRNTWNLDLTKDGGGNYWDDYKGNDRNGDNIGDSPYKIPDDDFNPFNNDKDKYPLMEPNGRPKTKTKSMGIQQITNNLIQMFLERFPLLNLLLQRLRI